MTTHLEFQLDSKTLILEQPFTLPKEKRVTSIAPKLHFFNNPPGTFTIEIKEGATVRGTKSLTVTEINTLMTAQLGSALDFKVGYFNFIFDAPINLKRAVEYTIKLSTSGYTFSGVSSVAWVKEYLNVTNELTDTPINDLSRAFSYRLWGYENTFRRYHA